MRLLVLGDVGVIDDMVHIGDEAMFEAARDELVARSAELTAISSAPAETSARYGLPAIGRIRFDGLDRAACETRLTSVLLAAEGRSTLPSGDPAHSVFAGVAEADGVVIAGGGNLASTWPLHIYERAALGGIAARFGRPLVISGQTLGPALDQQDRELVGALLRGARSVRVREGASQRLAAELGVTARLGVDDASFLGVTDASYLDADPPLAGDGILVSLSLSLAGAPRDETVRRTAALVDAAAARLGAPVRFHAHFGPLRGSGPRGDALLHEEVRAAMRVASSVVATGDARGAASLARSAALLITGRYHPAVFAAPAGVPVLGLVTDDYTAIKQRGALGHWGQDAVVPISAADTEGIERFAHVWADRAAIAREAARRLPQHRADSTAWWDEVVARWLNPRDRDARAGPPRPRAAEGAASVRRSR
jgi:polysaccharide pyruvyl transferase WcaK-like protein